VAHEVRNPLNAITGAAHYLATEYPDDETIQKFTSLIKRQSHHVDQVASDILHAARPLRLNRTRVDLDAVVEQALASLDEGVRNQRIEVERRSGPGSAVLQADEVQIEQAVYNVLKNAVEAMPEGGRLTVMTGRDDRTGMVTVSVQDTGCGIPMDERERIFDAFYTTKARGTGLGLSIVEGVLKNHGGSVVVEHPEGQATGTRIVLRIPAGAPPDRGPASAFPRQVRVVAPDMPRPQRKG